MPNMPDATPAGRFLVGGDIPVNRLGFGAMRITGPGIWGPPTDVEGALATLRRLPALHVNFIDTADSYGPHVSETLIHEALYPYEGMLIATKGGLLRHGPDQWIPLGDPAYLRQCVLMSLMRLGVARLDLWQLHRIDHHLPLDRQFKVLRKMQDEGLVRHIGLSEVTIDEIRRAQHFFPVVTVQNKYSVGEKRSEAVLDYCEKHNIGFIPWSPLDAGAFAQPGSGLAEIAARHQVAPGSIALAWLLKRSPVMLPIPGTGKVAHLEENVAAAGVALSDEEFAQIARLAAPGAPIAVDGCGG